MIHHSLLLREHVHVLTVSLSVLSKALYTKLHVEWWWRITYSFSAQMRFSSMQHRCYEVSSFSSELKILSFFLVSFHLLRFFLEGDGGVDFCFSHHALNRPSSSHSTHVLMQATDTALLHSERENGKNKAQSWKEIEWWTGLCTDAWLVTNDCPWWIFGEPNDEIN